ncbi:MAG: ATP-dependent helicase [Vampirovibrionales bacterium]|nr:ATP-dependent helicase [Vampirovibrionales bacterium]
MSLTQSAQTHSAQPFATTTLQAELDLNQNLILEAPLGSGKSTRLAQWVSAQLNTQRYTSAQILVLCANASRRHAFEQRVLQQLQHSTSQLNIYTYSGWVRNALFLSWPQAEAILAQAQKPKTTREADPVETALNFAALMPTLAGFEESEWLLDLLLTQHKHRNLDAFATFKGNRTALKRQLIRRIRLRCENRLTRADMANRSVLLGEPGVQDTQALEQGFDLLTSRLRTLDMARQLDVFHHLLTQEQGMLAQWHREQLRVLVMDDIDETTPAQQTFAYWLAPSLSQLALAADVHGGSRRGYLNAYPYDWPKLKALAETQATRVANIAPRTDAIANIANQLLVNFRGDALRLEALTQTPAALSPSACLHYAPEAQTRVEQWDRVVQDVQQLIAQGCSPGQIALISPRADLLTTLPLVNRFKNAGLAVQVFSGTHRTQDDPYCAALIAMLVLAYRPIWLELQLPESGLYALCYHALGWGHLPGNLPAALGETIKQLTRLLHEPLWRIALPGLDDLPWPAEDAATRETGCAQARAAYQTLITWFETARAKPAEQAPDTPAHPQALSPQTEPEAPVGFLGAAYQAFALVMAPHAHPQERFENLKRLFDRFELRKPLYAHLQQLGLAEQNTPFERAWLRELAQGSGSIADNPEAPSTPDPNALLIATPQKLIDLEARRQIQCWLDAGDSNWARTDTAPLYNAWVHSPVLDWVQTQRNQTQKQAIETLLHTDLARCRAGHLVRTLALLCTQQIRVYNSALDDTGRELGVGPLLQAFNGPQAQTLRLPAQTLATLKATLRADQQNALAYQSGTMAITAVPGAGKTYITVALVLALLAQHPTLNPDQILVLTYMDAAAKTLTQRIKTRLTQLIPGLVSMAITSAMLPTVTTIHGLAYKLLTEHENALLINLDPAQINIADDTEKNRFLMQAAQLTLPPAAPEGAAGQMQAAGSQIMAQDWAKIAGKGIDHAKALGLTVPDIVRAAQSAIGPNAARLKNLAQTYDAYQRLLAEAGLLDFTDLILLATQLLETQPVVRAFYQQKFRFILEDEAQDSSRLLQRFIGLLCAPSPADASEPHGAPNLVRIGDTNQSITTTFTAAEPEVFRAFIANAQRVVQMTQSGRCAPEVMQLANHWLQTAQTQEPALEGAFMSTLLEPARITKPGAVTPDDYVIQNPALLHPITCTRFDTDAEELAGLTQHVAQWQQTHPATSTAVLLRFNKDVIRVTLALQQAGIQAVAIGDLPGQQNTWRWLAAWLQVLQSPAEAEHWQALYVCMQALNVLEAGQHSAETSQALLAALARLGPTVKTTLNPDVSTLTAKQRAFWLQLRFDWLDDFRQATRGDICALLIRAADRVLSNPVDLSNAYLAAQYLAQALQELPPDMSLRQTPLAFASVWLNALSQGAGRKKSFLTPDEPAFSSADASLKPVVVMSLHKAKGQEFDAVWMPMLTARNLPSAPSQVKLDDADKLTLALSSIKQTAAPEPAMTPEASNWQDALKQSQQAHQQAKIAEEARLAYVGFTRAKRALFLSTHANQMTQKGGKWAQKPALAYTLAEQWLNAAPQTHAPTHST